MPAADVRCKQSNLFRYFTVTFQVNRKMKKAAPKKICSEVIPDDQKICLINNDSGIDTRPNFDHTFTSISKPERFVTDAGAVKNQWDLPAQPIL